METVNMRFKLEKGAHARLKSQAALADKNLEEHVIDILTKASNQNGERRPTHKPNVRRG